MRDKTGFARLFNQTAELVTVKRNTHIALFVPVHTIGGPINISSEEVANVSENSDLPDYITDMFERGCQQLTESERDELKRFLLTRQRSFADPKGKMETTSLGTHSIKLKDETPFKEANRRFPLFKRQVLADEIDKLEKQGIIERSSSPWTSQLVLVQKKDTSWRVCVDFRRLNEQPIKDSYPICRIDDNLDALSGAVWFSSLDLNMAYHQVPMDPDDMEKTAFATPQGGLWHNTKMAFGLCNAPATFSRIIEKALSGLQWHIAVLYLDDIIVYAKDFKQHLANVSAVIDRLDNANLKLKAKKCNFFCKEVQFLGYVVSQDGIKTDPSKVEAIKANKTPTNVTELKSFLGLASYYRKFVFGFALIANVYMTSPGKVLSGHGLRNVCTHSTN